MKHLPSIKQKSTVNYAALADEFAVNILMYVSDDGQVLYTSKSCLEIAGYTAEELTEHPITFFIPKNDHYLFLRTLKEIKNTENTRLSIKHKAIHKNGSSMWFESTFYNQLSNPYINAIVISLQNISPQTQLTWKSETAEANLDALINTTNDFMWSIDVDKRVMSVNNSFATRVEQLTGRKLKAGEDIFIHSLPKEIHEDWNSLYDRGLKGERFSVERKYTINNQTTYVNLFFLPIIENGTVTGVACCGKDASLKTVSAHESLLGSLINSISYFLVRIDMDGRFTYANKAFSMKFGQAVEAIIGRPALENVHKDDKEKLEHVIKSCIANPGSYISTLIRKVKHNTRDIIHTEWEFIAIEDTQGKVTEIQGIGKDVTDKIIVEKELVLNMAKLENTLESMTDGFFAINRDLQFIRVNKVFEDATGRNRNAVLGQHVMDVFPNMKDSLITRSVLKTVKKGGAAHIQEFYDDDGKWFEFNVYPTQEGAAIYFRDITERKLREAEIQKLNEELEKRVWERTKELTIANTELESFSYSVSHDLRAPLRSIDGFSEILLEDYYHMLDESGKSHLARIRNAAQKMSQLIDDLLKLSRVTRQPITKKEINLSEMALIICHEKSHMYQNNKFHIRIAENIRVMADQSLLNIALENLFDNAFKFASKVANPTLEFGIGSDDEHKAYFYVRDNGVGFDMQYADRLFSPFRRLHTDKDFQGTGIGLSIVKRVITRHNGKIWASSALNQGTTISFTLAT